MSHETAFSGNIPEKYDKYLGPLLFENFAIDLIERIQNGNYKFILEIACGTGIVSKYLPEIFTKEEKIVCLDLNPDMIEIAKKKVSEGRIEWKVADMQELPFEDSSFDIVFIQFGIMFVPDKEKAFREIYRVLKPGGKLLFNVMDILEKNQFAKVTNEILNKYFKDDPVTFYLVPFSYNNEGEIRKILAGTGFNDISFDYLRKKSSSVDTGSAVKGLLEGNPVLLQINERDPELLPVISTELREELSKKFGDKPMKIELNAIVCEAVK